MGEGSYILKYKFVRCRAYIPIIKEIRKAKNEKKGERRRSMTVIKIMKEVEILAAIVGIIILESQALAAGINGTLLILAIGAICGLAGYEIRDIIKMLKRGFPPPSTSST